MSDVNWDVGGFLFFFVLVVLGVKLEKFVFLVGIGNMIVIIIYLFFKLGL